MKKKQGKSLGTFLVFVPFLLLSSCTSTARGVASVAHSKPITPIVETFPVPSQDDSADDAAVWIHPQDRKKSKVIGTNKKSGILVYDLQGQQLFHWEKDPMNNVDVRYAFPFQGKKVDLVVGSSKDSNSLTAFQIDAETGHLQPVSAPIKSKIKAYGFCLYHDLKSDKFYGFVTGKEGGIEQWLLSDNGQGVVEGKLVRTLKVNSQTEGCVADDEYGLLYAAEEAVGVWKFSADPESSSQGELLASIASNSKLQADLEGVALYQTRHGQGYLIVSVQERDEFAVFSRTGSNPYLFSFSVKGNGSIDDVTHTDGIEVISSNLGPDFPLGVFISQDDENFSANDNVLENQNFKLTPWQSVANSVPFPLMMDNTWDPRDLQVRKVLKDAR